MKTIKAIILFLFLSLNLFAQSLLTLFDGGIPDDRGDVVNMLFNDGAKNTTDWVQTAETGDPDYCSVNATFSVIVDGSNWLRIERLGSPNDYAGIQGMTSGILLGGEIAVGHTYNIRVKIRGNGGAIRINALNGGWEALPTITTETIWTATPVVAGDASFYLTFNGEAGTDKYFEIDWIEVWE